jgi:hypothetical protein
MIFLASQKRDSITDLMDKTDLHGFFWFVFICDWCFFNFLLISLEFLDANLYSLLLLHHLFESKTHITSVTKKAKPNQSQVSLFRL